MNLKRLEEIIIKNDYSAFRLKQVKKQVFARVISDWDEATDLPEKLRGLLKEKIRISDIALIEQKESAERDTVKALFKTSDGFLIEAVLMKHDRNRMTVCVSSQVGCAMQCAFCATGKMGFARNLEAGDIIDQVLYFARLLNKEKEKVTNIVYMGMGEPFNNYDNVMESVRILNDKDCFNLGARHIAISTCGIMPGIQRFAGENIQVNLAISLHAPDDETRAKIMPVSRAYPLSKLMPAVVDYVKKSKRKVMFEYILIAGVNDSDSHAKALAALMKQNKLFHVNLIKYHSSKESIFHASAEARRKKFFDILKKEGVSVTFRRSFGEDISGACGQLIVAS
ncbi:MAG: 23S rRNA (adenine(2503)-C(2))-methyltransferase RlmN [Patescibacteria group bacterium]